MSQRAFCYPVAHEVWVEKHGRLLYAVGKILTMCSAPRVACWHASLLLRKLYARHIPNGVQPVCRWAMSECVILSDGTVTTCCLDAAGENRFGDITREDFDTIWNVHFRDFRRMSLLRRPLCFRCIGLGGVISPPICSSPEDRRLWSSEGVPYPKSLVLEISAACNYACDGCFASQAGKRQRPFIDLEKVKPHLSGVLPRLQRVRLYNYGEPLLHPDFGRILSWIRETAPGIRMTVATNGMLLDAGRIDQIITHGVDAVDVSVHGGPGTENMLRYSRKAADYERVLRQTGALIAERNRRKAPRPVVGLKAVLFRWNDTDALMDQLRSDGARAGVDRVYWTLDLGSGMTSRASRKYRPGSAAVSGLNLRGELV